MQSTLLSFIMTNVFDSNTNIVNDKNNWIILFFEKTCSIRTHLIS